MDGDHSKETVSNKFSFKTSILGLKVENEIGQLLIDSNSCWSKLEAQLNYLSSPPVCFIILSKPGLGEKVLGDRLAEYWNCVHINPDDVIQEQINIRSDTGRCIEFNLRCGNVITVEVILKLIEESLKTDVVQHRGYVLSGIPLVETYKSNDCCGELFSEEAFLTVELCMLDLLSTVEKLLDSQDIQSIHGEDAEEDIEPSASIAEDDTEIVQVKITIDYSTKFSGIIPLNEERDYCRRTSVYDQIDFITNLKTPPTVIIEISCPKGDIIALRGQNVLIYPKCSYFQMPFGSDTVCTRNTEGNDSTEKRKIMPNVTLYQCWRPSDFSHFVEAQFKKMTKRLKTAMKRYITLHDPQYVIKLDGRRSHDTNFEVVQTKLSILPLHRVLLPTLIQDFKPKVPEGDEDVGNVDDLSSKDFLDEFESKEKVAPRFPYSESLWRTKCPVALAERKCVTGTPKNAVILFDHIFLLSTESARQTFCRNPRPFLNNQYLTSTCRIAIVGTKKSGKSTLAKCLSWLFNGVIIDFKRLGQKIILEKEHSVFEAACDDALYILMKEEEEIFLDRENVRLAALDQWKLETMRIIERYAALNESEFYDLLLKFMPPMEITILPPAQSLLKISKGESDSATLSTTSKSKSVFATLSTISKSKSASATLSTTYESMPASATLSMTHESKSASATLSTGKIDSTDSEQQQPSVSTIASFTGTLQLVVNMLSGIADKVVFMDFCQDALTEPNIILEYAPSEFILANVPGIPTDGKIKKRARELINEEDRYDGINVTDDEIIGVLVEKIIAIDQNRITPKRNSKKLGWIIDGMSCDAQFWDALVEHDCLPDDVFSLTENTNIDLETFLSHKSRRRNDRLLNSIFDKMEEPLLELHQRSAQFRSKSSILSEISRMVTKLLEHDYFEDNKLRHVPSEMTAESYDALKASEFDTFVKETEQFNIEFNNLKSLLEACLIDTIDIIIPSAWSPSELIAESLKFLRYRYGVNCKPFISEDEATEEDDNPPVPSVKTFYGVFGPYCPVTFYKHAVLWKGREDFVQNYKQKTYYMASLEDQEEFLSDPEHFMNSEIPVEVIPPWRICITGPIGSGRSTMAKLLADKMGLIYINFCNFVFSCLLQSYQYNCRDFYNWLDEQGITTIIDELRVTASETDLETISQLKDYFIGGLPLPADILSSILSKLWFTKPFNTTGIILDGFPCHPSEIDTVKEYFYIPDLIIEMRASYVEVDKRLYKLNCLHWKNQQKARQEEYEIEKQNALTIWNSHRHSLFIAYFVYLEVENSAFISIDAVLIDSQNNSVDEDNYEEMSPEEASVNRQEEEFLTAVVSSEPFYTRTESNLSIGTRSEFSDLSESTILPLFDIPDDEIEYVTVRVDTAFPEPEFGNEWESEESAFERIKARIEEWYESDMEIVTNLKELCEDELIPWFQVDSLKRNERTLKIIERYVSEMKPRNESFFEQTTVIDMELAELLLSKGFYFLSKFGVSCPVRVFENDSLVQMFLRDKNNNNLYPILHRSYIYFCSGNENCSKFCKNPLIFIYSDKIDIIVHIPIRFAITGPPKSGKSTLSKRFQEEFGTSIWTLGHSIRCVLDNFPWTVLAQQIRLILSEAQALTGDLTMEAVKLCMMDVTSLSQGFVLDEFPFKTGEGIYMMQSGIFPYIIIELECTEDISKEYLQTNPDYYGCMPRYSEPFLLHWFKACHNKNNVFHLSVRQDYQNLETIDASWSKWRTWWETKKYFLMYMADIVRFLINSPGSVVPLGRFCITAHEFTIKASHLKDYCPTCLSNGILRRSQVFNRIGLVQWNSLFYWFCPEHYKDFLKSPYTLDLSLPDFLPARAYELNQKQLYENGRCIVSFSDNYPTRKIVKGSQEFAATYKDKYYIFADANCLKNFMEVPEKYYDKAIHYETETPLAFLGLSQLPALGYLEQCLSDMIIKATVFVAKIRPKYPGLTPAISAAILVGLFLKCNNPKMTAEALEIFQKIKDDFEGRCRMTKEYLDFMNLNNNPFLEEQVCCGMSDTYSLFSETTIESSPLPSRQLSSDHSGEGQEMMDG